MFTTPRFFAARLTCPAFAAVISLALLAPASWGQSQPTAPQTSPLKSTTKTPIRVSHGLLREGAFLANQPGKLISLEQGGSAFVFDKDKDGRSIPAMAMLPCTTLMRMEQIRDARSGEMRFAVSGQVFLKDGRNYLLPTFYKVNASKSPSPSAPPETIQDDPAAQADPTVAALIGSLDTLTPASNNDAGSALALPAGNLLPEGSFLKSRRGHIIRTSSGALALSVDNDADTADGPAAPLVFLPSRALSLIERMLNEHGESSVFKVSGRVYIYRGQNFLLPAMVQLQLDTTSGLSSAQ